MEFSRNYFKSKGRAFQLALCCPGGKKMQGKNKSCLRKERFEKKKNNKNEYTRNHMARVECLG